MAKTLTGLATVDGIDGTVTYTAIVANGALEPQQATVTDEADIRERRNQVGDVKGYKVSNKRKSFNVTCLATVSSGTSMADAVKAVVYPPIPGKVVLGSFDSADGAGINGDYVYLGGGSVQYADDWVRMVLPVVKPDATTADTLVTAVT